MGMDKHPKACEILPGILHEQNSVAMSNDQSVVKVERSDILVISNIQSIPLEESEGFDDGTSNLESTICIEKDEPMSDTKKEEATSDADIDENCDVSNIFDTNTFEFEDTNNEKVEPMTDTENDENCDTSNIKLESTSDTESVESYDTSVTNTSVEDDLSEYEKLRLKNIAETQAKF